MLKFRLVVDGIDVDDWDVIDALAEAAPGVQFMSRDGVTYAIVISEASLVDALLDVTSAVASVVAGARCLRVDEDFVAIPDVARRCDVSRETVRLWTLKPDFPAARGVVGNGIKIWDWATVNGWLQRVHLGGLGDTAQLLGPRDIERANALLRQSTAPSVSIKGSGSATAWRTVPSEGARST